MRPLLAKGTQLFLDDCIERLQAHRLFVRGDSLFEHLWVASDGNTYLREEVLEFVRTHSDEECRQLGITFPNSKDNTQRYTLERIKAWNEAALQQQLPNLFLNKYVAN